VPAFYDGEGTWRVRFSPGVPGRWSFRTTSRPRDEALEREGSFEATPLEGRGFLVASPGEAWGFIYESGEPALIFGDTTYNLFGMAHCGGDVEGFVRRRAGQGHNLLRVRLQVSPYHGPNGYSRWQTRRTWPWGGSEQAPEFERFNLDYFHTVDSVVELCRAEGMYLEMIMEAWGFEWPFNRRDAFLPEWERLWMRYLVARYDAFASVGFWTLMNEYEYYPDGRAQHSAACDAWAMHTARWLKGVAPHGHVVAVHNAPQMPPFARRFRKHPEAVDAVMFQCWGTTDRERGWLAAGIEEQVRRSLGGWPGSAVLAEYGYERNPEFVEERFPGFRYCDVDHTRRGAWRAAFSGLGVIHGWENTWGPDMVLDRDQEGMAHFLLVRRFLDEVVPFARVRPAPELIPEGDCPFGRRPLAVADEERELVAVYLPAGGAVAPLLPEGRVYSARWYDPRTGELSPAESADGRFEAPAGGGERPHDWALVLESG
jgi:hypothetical protein